MAKRGYMKKLALILGVLSLVACTDQKVVNYNTARLDNIEAYLANNKAVKPSENLEKLVEEGLLAGTAPNDEKITDTTPNLVEVKGIFYLLLQRAEKKNLIAIPNPVVEETTVVPTQTEEKSWRKLW